MQHLQPNTTLQGGKYRIERVLGQGGFGITYLARNTVFDIDVAIKEFFMKDENDRDGSSVTMPNATKQELFHGQMEKQRSQVIDLFFEPIGMWKSKGFNIPASQSVRHLVSTNVSKEELDKAYKESQNKIADHQIIEGTVISIDRKEVVVNIGHKSDGIIPASEFRYNPDLKVGDKVEVYVENVKGKKGQLILSHKKARLSKSWDRIKLAFDVDRIVQGYIKCRTDGGMIVDVFNLETFLPDSQIDVQPIQDYYQFVGKTMEFRIIKIINDPKFVAISHRAITDPNYDAYPLSKEIKIAVNSGIIIDEHDYDSKDFDEEYEEFMKNAYGEEGEKTDNPPDISQMVRTYGSLLPCPHCGSRYVDTFCDGTAKCRDCNKWYYYA